MFSLNRVSAITDESINQSFSYHQQQTSQQLLQLQGQCKIQKLTYLKLNYPKAILLTSILTLSIIGLLFLVWYKYLRVKIWYSQSTITELTHVYIQGGKGNNVIQKIHQNQQGSIYFYYKYLKYSLLKNKFTPLGLTYDQSQFQKYLSNKYITTGLNTQHVNQLYQQYGFNQHPVQIPNYFSYVLQVLLKPFFLLQYIVCIALIVQNYLTFAVLNLGFSVITTTINYILTYISYNKIKTMAEHTINVQVLRNGSFLSIPSNQLVPSDIINPNQQIMCDCIVLRGQLYVNQASLTGETVPIGKFQANTFLQSRQNNRWLYQGSKVVQKNNDVYALVVNTGYRSRRGRIIRKILTRVSDTSQIFKSSLYFLIQAFVVAMIIYFGTIVYMQKKHISQLIVGFRFVDFLGWSFPPTFPIYFNVAYTFAIIRLKNHGIICIQPDKSVSACNLKTMCFDKTGTLTQPTVQINQIYKFKDSTTPITITQQLTFPQNQLINKLFASCHTTKKINNQHLGDQIDLKMFMFSQYQIGTSTNNQSKFYVTHQQKKVKLNVIRINQFQSKYQSMSVLVRDQSSAKTYAFIKGAPQKLYKKSTQKIQSYNQLITQLSLCGYRIISFAYRLIPDTQIKKYLQSPRQIYQENITILGLIAFENKLKPDTPTLIHRLLSSGIQPKIITGDNIFIAIQTGIRSGIISPHQSLLLFQGSKQPLEQFKSDLPRTFKGIKLTRLTHHTIQQPIQFKQDSNLLQQNYPIAMDNDFLLLSPPILLIKYTKFFARISPQNKALIISKHKQIIDKQYTNKSFISKLCGNQKYKVGMCGDGANDLMAIRQSDIGIGFNDSDASYGSTFTLSNIIQIDQIIRDSKATTTNIVEMIRYYQFISFIKIPASLLMVLDSAYFNQGQLLFFNFTSTVIYPILQAMSYPSKIITKAIPDGNLFGPINHFRFWGSVIIQTCGLTAGYLYFRSTPNFKPNTHNIVQQTWFPATFTATCMFLLVLSPFSIYSLFFYIGKPWKQKIYKNYPLIILLILNIISTITMHYITKYALKQLGLLPISFQQTSIILLISIITCIFGFIYQQIITEIQRECFGEQGYHQGQGSG